MRESTVKIAWTLLIVIAITAFLTVSVYAFGHGHGGGGFGGFRMLMDLELSNTQKSEIKAVLGRYQDEQDALHERVLAARETFLNTVQAADFNEQRVREAFQAMSPALEDMAVFYSRLLLELKAVLTPEQLETLETRRAEFKEKHRDRREFRRAFMDAWLAQDNE